ncbi:alpha-2-antiplasmin [Tiliqua scincoides]|uniref:alpha-2-antiplasmin n=1 Tax=Tiliqua scincoides TaxID=71010 RepID=UPI0034627D52
MAANFGTLMLLFLPALHPHSRVHAEDGSIGQVSQPIVVNASQLDDELFLTNQTEPGSIPEDQEGLTKNSTLPVSPPAVPGLDSEVAVRDEGQISEENQSSSERGEEEEEEDGQDCDGDVPARRMHKIADAMMKFTADLLREVELKDNQSNVFLSPLSISLALAQLALGAANQTERHLLEVLHMESVPCLHQTLHSISQHLDKTMLNIAARLYLQKGFQVKEKYLEDSERFYGAKPKTLSGQNEADLAAINGWVKEATKGQIPTILTELPPSAVMVLLNAVHFQGFWRDKFDPDLTAPGVFHLDNEFIVPVQMMNSRKYSLSWFTLDALEVQVARFPFKGNLSLVAIVPNQFDRNVSQLLSELNKANLHSHFPKERPTIVKMPKMHLEYHLKLNEALTQLGLGELFSSPDFRHIAEASLFVSSIEHRSALELLEAGVEASAATSVVMSRSLSSFTLNQPFVFAITEDRTGIPIFFGYIRNPNPSAPRQRKEQQDSPDEKCTALDNIPK